MFIDDGYYACNLYQTTSGKDIDATATGRIDHENTALYAFYRSAPYQMVGADKKWIRNL